MLAIDVEGLTKRFGNFIAVDNVEVKVNKGEIFGFLGANGAGKTTTIKMLTGLISPSKGKIFVDGIDVVKYPQKVKEKIGYMSQKFSLYNDLTVEENINFFGRIYGLSTKKINSTKTWLYENFGLKDYESLLTNELPTGIKQRLALGITLMHEPTIVFLDEPTSGADPVSRRNFWEVIQELSRNGVSVFVTTHFLEEAEYCNSISFIHQGKIIAKGSPTQLKKIFEDYPIFEVDFGSPEFNYYLAGKKFDFAEFTLFGNKLHCYCKMKLVSTEDFRKILSEKLQTKILSLRKIKPSLEDVFVNYISSRNA